MATNLINEILRRCDRTPVEGSDPARKRIDETVQFHIRNSTIDVSVTLSRVAIEIIAAENDFERAPTAYQMREPLGTATARCNPTATSG